LSYHWLYPSGQVAIFEGKRSLLPGDIPPGTGRTIRAALQAPPSTGRYLLVWDIVQERVLWFSVKSGRFKSVTVQVRNPPANEQTVINKQRPALSSPEPAETLQALSPPGRGQLWAAALRMVSTHPLFGIGPDGFRLSYGAYSRPKQAQWDQRIFANNLVLELVADLGLVGGGFFMAFLLTAIWPLLVAAWQGQLVLWQVGVAGAMIAFLGHGLVDYILGAHAIFILFWLLCGLAAVKTAR
jgi:hypothetical protein